VKPIELALSPVDVLPTRELELTADAASPPPKRRWWVLWLLAAAIIAAAVIGNRVWQRVEQRRVEAQITLDLKKPPPLVEPVSLRKISADQARLLNASIPIVSGTIAAAAPFVFGQMGNDADRATDCLAATIYYEAANESLAGKMAVAQVVLNRVRHPAFPKTVCGVVFQGSERRTGCQFSYTCDGSLARRPSAVTWETLRTLARSMLGGLVFAPVGYATHYHANYVSPYWSSSLDKVHVEGAHIFYRFKGGWGTSRAFKGGYGKVEPGAAGLSGLSAAHQGVTGGLTGLVLSGIEPGVMSGIVPNASVIAEGADGQFIVRIERGADAAMLPALAQKLCGARDFCKLHAWTNAAAIPKALPVTEAQQPTAAFTYLRNRTGGFEKPLWNCATFPRADRKQCMRQRVVIEGKAEELISDMPDPEPVVDAALPKPELRADPVERTPQSTGRRRPGSN
jgi:spore germination cell wall hydrolase CwlJ-like protein